MPISGFLGMSRATTVGKQTADSLESIAANLEYHATALRAAATMLRIEPVIPDVLVEQEANRVTGLDRIGKWVPLVTQAVFSARINVSQNGRTRESGTRSTKR